MQARPGALEEPTRIIDLHVSELSDAHRFVDVRRHGTPIVLHDPDDLLVLRPDDPDAMAAAIDEAVDQAPAASRDRRVAGEPGDPPRARRGGVCTSTSASGWCRWSGWYASSTAPGATTSGCATGTRTCLATCAARLTALLPGAGIRRSCPGSASPGWTSVLARLP